MTVTQAEQLTDIRIAASDHRDPAVSAGAASDSYSGQFTRSHNRGIYG
jgi:hypothetical protein